MGAFCFQSKKNQKTNQSPLLFWFTTSSWEWLKTFDCLKHSSVHREAELNSQVMIATRATQSTPVFMLLLGYQTFHIWITLDMMRFLQAWHLNALHHTTHHALQIYLGCKRVGNLMRKVEQSSRGTTESSLEKDWMPAGGLILNALIHCWWETTCFLWSTATCIVKVISFFTSLLGCFTIKAL